MTVRSIQTVHNVLSVTFSVCNNIGYQPISTTEVRALY